ncbi:fucolectin-like [Macrobrachium rosenbergii]|uniref:fucolectin-like n=1 Tax=Macrobrachium rosenbergii TaxID=79674 RepID=UPI0034D5DA28
MLIRFIIYCLLLSSRRLGIEASLGGAYAKVTSSFPSGMNNCLLQTISVRFAHDKDVRCATLCLRNANCRLFCIKGDDCSLFKTFVTAEYNGTAQDSFGFTSCYTSWFFSKNLAPRAVVTMSSIYSVNQAEYQAINGYFCYAYDSCSITLVRDYPWWKADLQKTYFVSALVVKPRDDNLDFNTVEIRFGNSPTISQNPIFATHAPTTPPAGTVLTFKSPNPMEGRYLSFQTFSTTNAVSICEVQIIEA